MNLNDLSISGLQSLFSAANDEAGNHILWVDAAGDVHLDLVPYHLSPNGFEESEPSMRARFSTFCQGNGYVGPAAAADPEWMERLFRKLARMSLTTGCQFVDDF